MTAKIKKLKLPVKPKPRTITLYDYNECIAYVEQKYGFDSRDFHGLNEIGTGKKGKRGRGYDFWGTYWCGFMSIHNDQQVTIYQESMVAFDDDKEAQQILNLLHQEFGPEITFLMSW